jgi:hypothetical protein
MCKLFLLLCAFCAGCGSAVPADVVSHRVGKFFTLSGGIDAEAQSYIDYYRAEGAKRGADLGYSDLQAVSYVADLSDGTNALWGVCDIYDPGEGGLISGIKLNPRLNTDVPAIIKKLIFIHELSHGLLGVMHTPREEAYTLQIMFWASGQAQVDNAPNYEDSDVWKGYLDFLFGQKALEQTP